MTTYVTLDAANSAYRMDYLGDADKRCHRCGAPVLDRDQDGNANDETCSLCGKHADVTAIEEATNPLG